MKCVGIEYGQREIKNKRITENKRFIRVKIFFLQNVTRLTYTSVVRYVIPFIFDAVCIVQSQSLIPRPRLSTSIKSSFILL